MKNNSITIVVLIIAALASLILGSNVAREDYTQLTVYALFIIPIVFLVWGYKYSWQIVAFLVFGEIAFYQGFLFTSVHAGTFIILAMFIVHFFQRIESGMPKTFSECGGRGLVIVSLVWVLYGVLHFAFNFALPHVPGDFGVKNSLKAYFAPFIPVLLLYYFMWGPTRFKLSKNWDKQLLWILFGALIVNIFYMAYLYLSGYTAQDSIAGGSDESNEARGFIVPVINASPHIFGLRSLGPLGVVISLGFLTTGDWFGRQSRITKLLVLSVLPIAIIGSVLSGGRAAVLLGGFYGFVILASRGRIGLLMVGTAAAVLLVLFVNLFSNFINYRAPTQIARPLQYVMIEKGQAMKSIEGSSDYRGDLFNESIDHWRSDPRVLLFGRSVYRYLDNEDDLRARYGDKENFIVTNLRAGTCHALLPSSLVQYGILGTTIYYLWTFTLIVFLFRLDKRIRPYDAPGLQTLTFTLKI